MPQHHKMYTHFYVFLYYFNYVTMAYMCINGTECHVHLVTAINNSGMCHPRCAYE